jgi:hypothetical protein
MPNWPLARPGRSVGPATRQAGWTLRADAPATRLSHTSAFPSGIQSLVEIAVRQLIRSELPAGMRSRSRLPGWVALVETRERPMASRAGTSGRSDAELATRPGPAAPGGQSGRIRGLFTCRTGPPPEPAVGRPATRARVRMVEAAARRARSAGRDASRVRDRQAELASRRPRGMLRAHVDRDGWHRGVDVPARHPFARRECKYVAHPVGLGATTELSRPARRLELVESAGVSLTRSGRPPQLDSRDHKPPTAQAPPRTAPG